VKRVVVLAGLALVLASVAACSSSVGGSGFPTPATSAGTTSGDSTGSGGGDTTPSGTGSSGTSLANTDPCSLLSSSDAATAGLQTPGTSDQVGSEPACDYIGSQYTVIVAVLTQGGLSVFSGSTSMPIGSHPGALKDSGGAGCQVAIGVTSSSRVDVAATSKTGGSGCAEAESVAKLVEPHLPAS
jgi:hypothetical protein